MYTYAEMADVHLMYGRANRNECEVRLYQEHFLQRRIPDRKMYFPLINNFEKIVRLSFEHTDRGWPRRVYTPQIEEEIFDEKKLLYLHR